VIDAQEDSPINSALRQFEATEANVAKLERLWTEICKLTPSGLQFGSNPIYEERVRVFEDVLAALPKIDGWKPERVPMDLNSIGHVRLDAKEVGEISAEIAVEEQIEAPGREVAEYRHRLNGKRRQLIRSVMSDLIAGIDETLRSLSKIVPKKPSPARKIKSHAWKKLKEQIQEIDTLLGSGAPRPTRWSDIRRHLHFGAMQDLTDIVRLDWPEVKAGLTKGLFNHDEPLPVEVADLGILAAAQPKGKVVTKLKWDSLGDEDFERLVFSLINDARGYENPEWLTRTNAPDRGRDLSASRVSNDSLSGTIRSRVLIQCRNWLNKSIAPSDVATLKEQIATWEPPKIDILVIATSGRFTSDAVAAIEKHNAGDRALRIEMWPESNLERLLAERPALIAEFGLR
jgi:Restriction endonuclease